MRKRKSLCQLTPDDLESVVDSVNVKFYSYKQTADLHGVKPALVQRIMAECKKDSQFISKRRSKAQ